MPCFNRVLIKSFPYLSPNKTKLMQDFIKKNSIRLNFHIFAILCGTYIHTFTRVAFYILGFGNPSVAICQLTALSPSLTFMRLYVLRTF